MQAASIKAHLKRISGRGPRKQEYAARDVLHGEVLKRGNAAELAWRHMHAAAGLEAPGAIIRGAFQELVQRDGPIMQASHAQVAQGTFSCT